MHLRRLTTSVVLTGVLVLAGCGGDAEEPEDPAVSSPSPEVQDAPTAPADDVEGPDGVDEPPAETSDARGEVPEGLDWALDDLNGGQVVGADLAGGDVILWFWAPW